MTGILRVQVLKNLIWRDVYQQRKSTLIFLGVLTVALFVFGVFTRFESGDFTRLYAIWYGILFYIFGFFHTAGAYREFSAPATLQDYLLLPASHLEKWLSRWVRSLPMFVFTFTVAFFLAVLFFQAVALLAFKEHVPFFNPFRAEVFSVWKWFVITHAIALIGAIQFNKYPAFKLILALFLIYLTSSIILGIVQFLIYKGGGVDMDESTIWNLTQWYQEHEKAITWSWHGALFLLLVPLLYYISYLKLTEKEV
jgi:hypothetical protein